MSKTLKPKNIEEHDKDAMAVFGALLLSDNLGIREFKKYLENKDKDYWNQVKGVAFHSEISEKDMWINIGKAKGLEDLKIFFDKCIKKAQQN